MLTEDEKIELEKTAAGLKKIGENFLDSKPGRATKYFVYFIGGAVFLGVAFRVLAYTKDGYNRFRDKF